MDKKLLSSEEKKVAIKAELVAGTKPRYLAELYGVHYTTVMGYRAETRAGGEKNEVLEIAETDGHIIRMVADGIKEKVANADTLPSTAIEGFVDKVDQIVESVDSLRMLQKDFHKTATKLLQQADKFITEDMTINQFKQIAQIVGQLHTDIFAKGGMQVNVQQNNGSSSFSNGMVN